MGAGIALQAALHSNASMKGLILDSTFLLEPDTLYYNLRQHLPLTRFPSVLLMKLLFPLLNGVHMGQIPYSEIRTKQYDVPILMIHGKQDDKAPYEIALSISENQISNKNSALWLLPNGKHELIFRVWPEEYLDRSFSFMAGL
jgi:pimeloyl-ACP methyl ester carboxylesterase